MEKFITNENQNSWERLYLNLTQSYDNATWNGWIEDKNGEYCDIKDSILYFDVAKLKKDGAKIPDYITELSIPLKTADNIAHECGKLGIHAFSIIIRKLIEIQNEKRT
jgi:hypothetical protein